MQRALFRCPLALARLPLATVPHRSLHIYARRGALLSSQRPSDSHPSPPTPSPVIGKAAATAPGQQADTKKQREAKRKLTSGGDWSRTPTQDVTKFEADGTPKAQAAKRPFSTSAAAAGAPLETIDTLIIEDHAAIKALFQEYQSSLDQSAKLNKLYALIYELAAHSAKEELVVYPFVGSSGHFPDGQKVAAHCKSEHQELKHQLKSVDRLTSTQALSPEHSAALHKVIATFVKHADEEEDKHLLPLLRQHCSREQLLQLGRKFRDAEKSVATRPHPLAPSSGLIGLGAHLMSKPLDLARDWVYGRTDAIQHEAKDAHKRVEQAMAQNK